MFGAILAFTHDIPDAQYLLLSLCLGSLLLLKPAQIHVVHARFVHVCPDLFFSVLEPESGATLAGCYKASMFEIFVWGPHLQLGCVRQAPYSLFLHLLQPQKFRAYFSGILTI